VTPGIIFRDTFSRTSVSNFYGPTISGTPSEYNAYGPTVNGEVPWLSDPRNRNQLPAGRTWTTGFSARAGYAGQAQTGGVGVPGYDSQNRAFVYIGTVGTAAPASWGASPPAATDTRVGPAAPWTAGDPTAMSNVSTPGMWGGLNSWMMIDTTSGGSYVRSNLLSLRVDLQPNNTTQTDARMGAGLGFWSAAPTSAQDAWTNFTGLRVRWTGSNRTLQMLVDGAAIGSAITISGAAASLIPLQFGVDVSTGALTSVNYAGAALTPAQISTLLGSTPNTQFTAARVAQAGMYSVVSGTGVTGFGAMPKFDNFELIPEPSTYAAVAGVLTLGLAVLVRRRSKKTNC
jgi:hypothetical protein